MTNPEFNKPTSLQERLAAAKAAFRSSVLQNDTLFSVLQARLSEPSDTDINLPDFGLEPTLHRNNDSTSIIGLRINRSITNKNGVTSVYAGAYDYLPLGRMNRTTGDTKVSPELEAALTVVGKEKIDALDVLQAWQAATSEMSAQFPGLLALDPMTGTFELQEELMTRNYMISESEE